MGKNVQNFKRLLLWSLWANVARISFRAYLGQWNERLLSRTKDALWQNLCTNHHGGEGYQLLKWWLYIGIWPLYGKIICFCMHLYGSHTFVWKKMFRGSRGEVVWNSEHFFPYKCIGKHLGQCCSNFIWSLLGAGERKIAKMGMVHWSKWLLCPYMVKTFKNLLQNQISRGL